MASMKRFGLYIPHVVPLDSHCPNTLQSAGVQGVTVHQVEATRIRAFLFKASPKRLCVPKELTFKVNRDL